MNTTYRMILLDLFAGIGGFALAAKQANLPITKTFFSEIEPHAIAIYQKNFPDAVPLGDIRGINGAKLKQDHPDEPFLICGGFPCQDLSDAGPRTGLNGTRSGLWWEMYRVIGEVQPAFAVIENVPALRNNGLDRVLFAFAQIGYDAEWEVISARSLGAPHKRERIWVVTYPNRDRQPAEANPQHQTMEGRQAARADMGDEFQPDEPSQGDNPWSDWKGKASIGSILPEPILRRVDDGVSPRLDLARLKALGNAIVPQVVASILRMLPLNKT